MACMPPQAPASRNVRRRIRSMPMFATVAIVGFAAVWPSDDAYAARSCEAWSAEVRVVEGRVEIRRRATAAWVALAAGDRVCTDDLIRVESSSRATLVLPDGGTL